ncbi:FAD-dependent oxidoreductase [Natronomonas salina]|uniref:NAD(P)/FAD-dependent oxidoreductase n=1 Tax=Natronomonas salina TaxID=1710540 RepID=UPI0015B5EACB|nr:FAD-dependent oxidoreductase [Natronomonas salina]
MRVAVLGAGYAGLTVARRLERTLPERVELVVVDESRDHLVQHELHRVVRRPDLEETITVPLDDVLDRATVRRARVRDVDPERGTAALSTAGDERSETLTYDVGVVCLGAETAFYDLPGVESHAVPLKRLEHARRIRREALAAEGGTAVVGGAGLSGVQVAGELAALSRGADLGLDVRLVEMADRVAPGFDPVFADAIGRELEARGVSVTTGVAIDRAEADSVHLADGRQIPADVLVWTGGIRGSAALDGERLPVDADLQVSDSTFVVGDAAAVVDAGGRNVPASARTAIGEARVAAKNVVRRVNESTVAEETAGTPPRRYSYEFDELGWVVSVGDGAVAQVGSVVLGGDPARAMKAVVGAGHLGSVGEVRQASELVRRELGWPDPGAVDLPFDPAAVPDGVDPAVLGTLQDSLLGAAVALSRRASPDETVDLTGVTRLGDRSHPDSSVNALGRLVSNSIDAARAFGRRRSDSGRDEE